VYIGYWFESGALRQPWPIIVPLLKKGSMRAYFLPKLCSIVQMEGSEPPDCWYAYIH